MENYHVLERIGEGSFGKVYRGRRKFTGQIVALKFVSKRGKSAKDLQSLRQEISILRRLDHHNIIAMMDSFETDGEFCMVTEYAPGELFQVLEDDHQLVESEIRSIAIQLLQALRVLHTNRIIHRDMKPQNILIGSKQQIKLCDFGFARTIAHDYSMLSSIKGTPLYMAPELVQEKPYNHTVDLWSLGVILYELAVGRPPFYTDRIVTLIQMIIREPVKYPPTMSAQLQSFLAGLLTKDPAKRLTWPEVQNHPFVVETPEEIVAREQLERDMRPLPRFFADEETEVMLEHVNPSVERLKNCGEWKKCDPETGLQVAVEPLSPTQTALTSPNECLKSIEAMQRLLRNENDVAAIESKDWGRAWNAFISVPYCSLTTEVKTKMIKAVQGLYRAGVAVLKRPTDIKSISRVVGTGKRLQSFTEKLPHEGCIVDDFDGDLVYHCVRAATVFSNIVNTVEPDVLSNEHIVYREIYRSNLHVMATVLNLPGSRYMDAISKTLKWLGSMIDRSRFLADFLEEAHSSGVVESLCHILSSSGYSRSPSGRTPRAGRDLEMYSIFALASLVHPDGSCWGRFQSFPITLLRENNVGEANHENYTEDVRRLNKLRTRVHAEVTTHLLQSGVDELIAILFDEVAQRCKDASSHKDDDDEPEQSPFSCVVKILLHACRSSSPLSKRLQVTKPMYRDMQFDGVVSAVLDAMTSGAFIVIEQHFAVELLTVLLRRGVMSKRQTWACTKVLYPRLLVEDDVGLASMIFMFFSDAVDGDQVDVTALGDQEKAFGLESQSQEIWDLLVHGIISNQCADATIRFFSHQKFSALNIQCRIDRLQIITSYNVRAQGLLDAGIVFLLRVATKALKHVNTPDHTVSESLAVSRFLGMFENESSWRTISLVVANGGEDLLSPWGLFCFLKLVRMLRELQANDPSIDVYVNELMLPQLISLLDVKHFELLYQWPEVVGGGSNAVKALVHAIVKVLGIPFMHNGTDEQLMRTQETLYDLDCVRKLLDVIRYVFQARESQLQLEESVLELPMSFLSRLVTSSEHFGTQFVEADGLVMLKDCGVLVKRSSPALIIDTVLIVSQLARSSQQNYDSIMDSQLLLHFRNLTLHPEPMVRAKVLNCIGNLCRHSALFYNLLVTAGQSSGSLSSEPTSILDGMIQGLVDPDAYVRRFACFAIGNAAFHNGTLYSRLSPAIPSLVRCLQDHDEKTRSNAAGALGNMIRNASELCETLCQYDAPAELAKLALTDPSTSCRRIVLFSVGNCCTYPCCVASILARDPEFSTHLEELHDATIPTDDVLRKNIRRVLAKLADP